MSVSNGGASSAPSEEDLMRTRLTIDGDGMGDDRRLTLLLKNVIKFCSAPSSGEDSTGASAEEMARSRDRIVAQLAQAQWMDAKSKLAQEMNRVELKNYEDLYKEIESGIQKAHEDIAQAKKELVEARKVRRNKMEYDAMAKVISQNPDRATLGNKLNEVQEELEQLKEVEEALDEKLEMRKKAFHVMIHSIQQLQRMLEREQGEADIGGDVKRNEEEGEEDKDEKETVMEVDIT